MLILQYKQVVKTRNGKLYIYLPQHLSFEMITEVLLSLESRNDNYLKLKDYDGDLLPIDKSLKELDIVEVFEFNSDANLKSVWKRIDKLEIGTEVRFVVREDVAKLNNLEFHIIRLKDHYIGYGILIGYYEDIPLVKYQDKIIQVTYVEKF